MKYLPYEIKRAPRAISCFETVVADYSWKLFYNYKTVKT